MNDPNTAEPMTAERLAEMRRMAEGVINRQGEDASAPVLLSEVVALIDNVKLWQQRAVQASVARADSLQRANAAEAKVDAGLALADRWEHGALRWQDPLAVPPHVGLVREALGGIQHGPDLDVEVPGEDPSCLCGFNGSPKECWKSRTQNGPDQLPREATR